MGRKKTTIRIPKNAKIKCPNCGKNTLIKMPKEALFHFKCKKCKKEIEVPQSQCCMLCAYGNTPCMPELLRTAQRKGLEIKYSK